MNRTLDFFIANLNKTLTYEQAIKIFGEPDRDVGSGLYIPEYDLDDGSTIILGFATKIVYARHFKDGITTNIISPAK